MRVAIKLVCIGFRQNTRFRFTSNESRNRLSAGHYVYSLSNFEIRRDVTRGRLRILGELLCNANVVWPNGNAAKHVRSTACDTQSTACDNTSNLEVGQRVIAKLDRDLMSLPEDLRTSGE